MSHELSIRASGKVEMAYAGALPWHHLGTKLEANAPTQTWIEAAGMDWTIESAPVEYRIPSEGAAIRGKVASHKVQFRSDSKAPLAVVGANFQNVQPLQVADFFREECESHGWAMETMGVLFGGRQFWALASIGDESRIFDKRDILRNFMLMSTACDGTRRTEFRQTMVRVVCNNTISQAHGVNASFSVSHKSAFDAQTAKRALQMDSTEVFANSILQVRAIAEKRLALRDAIALTVKLFKGDSEKLTGEEFEKAVKSRAVDKVLQMYGTDQYIGADMDGVSGTAWGWLNVISEITDHHAQAKSVDHRLDSAWFGKNDVLKSRALELATAL